MSLPEENGSPLDELKAAVAQAHAAEDILLVQMIHEVVRGARRHGRVLLARELEDFGNDLIKELDAR